MPDRRPNTKLTVGAHVAERELVTISGAPVRIPDADHLVHLQLRRFAGCPVCNLHLRSIVRRHDEIVAAGVHEVVVFHSTAADLRPHAGDLPFAVIADPDKRLYAEFGVEYSPRALLDARAWLPIARGVVRSLWAIVRRREPAPSMTPRGGRFGLPADVLVGPEGRVLVCEYGTHVYDQWSVDELLTLFRSVPDDAPRGALVIAPDANSHAAGRADPVRHRRPPPRAGHRRRV
jgi:hypothetical protein